MTEMKAYEPGTFSWVELATSDAEAAKSFYGSLFGWALNDTPTGPDMVYTMAEVGGKPVAALYQQGEDQASQRMPPQWMSYVTVASADDSAAKAKSLGGTVMMDAFDVMDVGRMAVVQDPTGAVVALWEAKAHIGAHIVNEPGALSWNELATRDTKAAGEFYTKLFDWGSQVQEMPNMVYTTFLNGERMTGGMMQITEEWAMFPHIGWFILLSRIVMPVPKKPKNLVVKS